MAYVIFRVTRLSVRMLSVGIVVASLVNGAEPPAEPVSPIAQESRRVGAAFKESEEKLKEKLKAATGDQQVVLREELRQLPYKFAPEFIAIAKQYPTHADAFGPLLWCLVNLDSSPDFDAAIVLLGEHFKRETAGTSLNLYMIVPELVDKESAEIDPFLEAMARVHTDPFSQGNVLCGLAQRKKEQAGRSGSPDDVAAAGALLRDIIQRYPDVQIRSGPLKETAERELENLCGTHGIGKTAPEIEGTDLNGTPLRLSDYGNRVVVLSFSGHWCGPCRRAHPHLQALVEKHADDPFVLLEVNSDKDPGAVQEYMQQHGLTWRCFADGSTDGPISTDWGIDSSPRICVIDQGGIIRHKAIEPRPEELQSWVESLLRPAP